MTSPEGPLEAAERLKYEQEQHQAGTESDSSTPTPEATNQTNANYHHDLATRPLKDPALDQSGHPKDGPPPPRLTAADGPDYEQAADYRPPQQQYRMVPGGPGQPPRAVPIRQQAELEVTPPGPPTTSLDHHGDAWEQRRENIRDWQQDKDATQPEPAPTPSAQPPTDQDRAAAYWEAKASATKADSARGEEAQTTKAAAKDDQEPEIER